MFEPESSVSPGTKLVTLASVVLEAMSKLSNNVELNPTMPSVSNLVFSAALKASTNVTLLLAIFFDSIDNDLSGIVGHVGHLDIKRHTCDSCTTKASPR